jgi:PAP2 superfamily protein
MTTCELTATSRASQTPRRLVDRGHRPGAKMRPKAKVELALLALLYVGYTLARLLGDADLPRATSHAYELLHIEDALHLDVERPANRMLDSVPLLALIGSYWYSLLHYVVTPAVLLWAYRRHPLDYRRVRNALVVGSGIGLVGFTLLPMAPPRMLPGYVDTLATTAQHGWWGGDASAPKGLGALTNQLAAMPSLHVGWALWCAWVVVSLTRRRWVRILAIAYPVGTTLVVIGTANHYVLDAVAGIAVMVVGMRVARRVPAPAQAQPEPDPEPVAATVADGAADVASLPQAA